MYNTQTHAHFPPYKDTRTNTHALFYFCWSDLSGTACLQSILSTHHTHPHKHTHTHIRTNIHTYGRSQTTYSQVFYSISVFSTAPKFLAWNAPFLGVVCMAAAIYPTQDSLVWLLPSLCSPDLESEPESKASLWYFDECRAGVYVHVCMYICARVRAYGNRAHVRMRVQIVSMQDLSLSREFFSYIRRTSCWCLCMYLYLCLWLYEYMNQILSSWLGMRVWHIHINR